MKNVEIHQGNWTADFIRQNSDKIFIYGDNDLRTGKGGQAVIRGLDNTIGIRTKKGPSNKPIAFYSDKEFVENCKKITEDLLLINSKLCAGKTIVLSNGGYGTGLADLKSKAPMTYQFLSDSLKSLFEFDNESGILCQRIPSIDEIQFGQYLDFNKQNSNLLLPVNNSFFSERILKSGTLDFFGSIKNQMKFAFTSKLTFNKGQILILSFPNQQDYLVVEVIMDSYNIQNFDLSIWSELEGLIHTPLNGDLSIWNQTLFSYVCQLNENGKVEFRKDLFKDIKESDVKKLGTIVDKTLIDENLEGDKNLQPFKELLQKQGLLGEITKIKLNITKKPVYQVKVGDTFYAIEYNKFFFWNSINILLTSKNPFI